MNWRRVLVVACGIALIIDGFTGWNVRPAAIVVGLILVGALPAEWVADLIAAGRTRARQGHEGHEGHGDAL